MKGSKKYLSQNLLSDFLAVFGPIPGGFSEEGFERFSLGFDWLKILATNGAQMQRRNFLSSIFAALFVAKTR